MCGIYAQMDGAVEMLAAKRQKTSHANNAKDYLFCRSPETRLSSNHAAQFNREACLFCQRSRKRKGSSQQTKLCLVESQLGTLKIQEIARAMQDKVFLRISGHDLVAIGARYHGSCRSSYIVSWERVRNNNTWSMGGGDNLHLEASQLATDGSAWDLSFSALLKDIDQKLTGDCVVTELSELCHSFNELLVQNGLPENSCSDKKLKRLLVKHRGDNLNFQKQSNPSQSQLVFQSSLHPDEMILKVKQLNDDLHDSALESSFNTETEVKDDLYNVLYKAAQIIKGDLHRCKNHVSNPVHADSIDLDESRPNRLVPNSVYALLKWIIADDSDGSGTDLEHVSRASADSNHRLILAVGQDLVYACSKGRVSTPKHVGLAMSIKHLTGSKQVITMLNRCGHTISYDNLERIETAIATEQLQKVEKDGVLAIPSNISPGCFVQCAADNIDFNENTFDGKGTTHATSIVLYQQNSSDSLQGEFAQTKLKPDTCKRRRSIDKLSVNDVMRTFSHSGKRPVVPFYNNKVKPEWYARDGISCMTGCRLDFAWILVVFILH